MENKLPQTQRELEFYCDKVIAEYQLRKARLQLAALNQILKENRLVPITQEKQERK